MRHPDTVRRANRRRGEVEAVIEGERRILCLTLGALAELETAFGVEDLAALGARFQRGRLTSNDLIRILAVGLRGGGNRCSDEDVAGMAIEGGVTGAARIVGELLAATFADGEAKEDRPIAFKTRPLPNPSPQGGGAFAADADSDAGVSGIQGSSPPSWGRWPAGRRGSCPMGDCEQGEGETRPAFP